MAVNVTIIGNQGDFGPPAPNEDISYPNGDDFEIVTDVNGYNTVAYILREGKRIAYVARPIRVEIVQEVA